MKYQNLAEVFIAFQKGELDRKKHTMIIDNDSCFLISIEEELDETLFKCGGPEDLVFQALMFLNIPVESA